MLDGHPWWIAALVCTATACCPPAPESSSQREERPSAERGNQRITSFYAAKRKATEIYKDHRITIYCGCRFDSKKRVNATSCGYIPRKPSNGRSRRIEWEHVVPASVLGQRSRAWKHGDKRCKGKRGRSCARKVDRAFALMEADLYNLFPAIGEVNAHRSNKPVGLVEGEARRYGRCDVEIADVIEPAPKVRGDVARAYLYMDWAYPAVGILSDAERVEMQRWSREDPPDAWERERARRIEAVQGNTTPFLTPP